MKLKKLLPLLLLILIISNAFAIGTTDFGDSAKVAPVVTFRVGAPPDAPASAGSSTSGSVSGSVSTSLAVATGGTSIGLKMFYPIDSETVVGKGKPVPAGVEVKVKAHVLKGTAVYAGVQAPKTGGDAALYLWRSTEAGKCTMPPTGSTKAKRENGNFDVYYGGTLPKNSNDFWFEKWQKIEGTKAVGDFLPTITVPEKEGEYTYCSAFTIPIPKGKPSPYILTVSGQAEEKFLFTEIQYGESFTSIDSKIKELNNKSSEFYDFKNPTPFKLKLEGIDKIKSLYLAIDFTCPQQLDSLNRTLIDVKGDWQTVQKQSYWNKIKGWWSKVTGNTTQQLTDDYAVVGQLLESGQIAKATGVTAGLAVGRFTGGVIKFGAAAGIGLAAGLKEALSDLREEIKSGDLTVYGVTNSSSGMAGTVDTSNVISISKLGVGTVLSTPLDYLLDYLTVITPDKLSSTALWQINSINGTLSGQHKFYACQFRYDLANKKMTLYKDTYVGIKFGGEAVVQPTTEKECSTVPDCLARIDKKFVDSVFPSTVSNGGTSDSVNTANGTTSNAGTGTGSGTTSGTGTASNSPAISIPDSSSTASVQPAASGEVKKKL